MPLQLFQVDAFTSRVFSGNPAAVVPLDRWLDDELMQAIARENNLSETAFLVGAEGRYDLRWFTPVQEVDLCGHATLAASRVLFEFFEPDRGELAFSTRSGTVRVEREGDRLCLDFPSRPGAARSERSELSEALGEPPDELYEAAYYMAVFPSEEIVRKLQPDMAMLAGIRTCVIATARGEKADFVSRFFAPALGVPEDPVTGSAHCTLVPYWAKVLGKDELYAQQVSRRGGELFCANRGERVRIAGNTALYLRGEIQL